MKRPRPLWSDQGLAALSRFLSSKILLAFDLDGTLVPIVTDYMKVRMTPACEQELTKLSRRVPTVVVSGRSVKDLRTILELSGSKGAIKSLRLVGNHGLEGLTGEGRAEVGRHKKAMSQWRRRVQDAVKDMQGVHVEDKKLSMTIHFRNAPSRTKAKRAILRKLSEIIPGPRVMFGKAVFNLLPSHKINKGSAILKLMKTYGCHHALYVGDDVTDEDVFKLRNPNILTIRVGRKTQSQAKYYIPNQKSIVRLLREINVILSQSSSEKKVH